MKCIIDELNENDEGICKVSNDDNLLEVIFDFDLSNEDRLLALEKYQEQFGEAVIEISNRIFSMYLVSGTKLLREFIVELALNSKLEDTIKIEGCKVLCCKYDILENFEVLDKVISLLKNVPIPCKIDAIFYLMRKTEFDDNSLEHFKNVINNQEIECDYRYKTVISLESKNKIPNKNYFLKSSLFEFIHNSKNMTQYRILCGQYLLQKIELQDKERTNVQFILFNFMNDTELDYDIRADATDVLLHLGDEEHRKLAQNMIITLGGGTLKTVFDNKQNVHHYSIEESANLILEHIHTLKLNEKSTFKNAQDELVNIVVSKFKKELELKVDNYVSNTRYNVRFTPELKHDAGEIIERFNVDTYEPLRLALNRITLDRAVYGKFNSNLSTIFMYIWNYILNQSKDIQDELKGRMIEELVDSAKKCATGYVYRLVNVLSGYTEYNIKISWEDQIVANLSGRLNKRIRDIEDEELRGDIMSELTMIGDENLQNRFKFLAFFRSVIPKLRQEMWEEFKDYITDPDFDLYFRKAISKYEGMDMI